MGHHIGDLRNWETLTSFTEGVEHFQRLFAVEPELVAHDLHPDYLSTGYALRREGVAHVGVQHHHAHLAACLAEHGETGPAVGAIYDGTGYGTDGTAWGGELLVGDLDGLRAAGMLLPVRLPGGDRAAAEPWRMACAWLALVRDGEPPRPRHGGGGRRALARGGRDVREGHRLAAHHQHGPALRRGGRPLRPAHDGDATRGRPRWSWRRRSTRRRRAPTRSRSRARTPLVLDARGVRGRGAGRRGARRAGGRGQRPLPPGRGAGHGAALERLAGARGLDLAVLSGGVFQNRALLERTSALAERAGLRVLTPVALPPNDGGISFGQAAVAAARTAAGSP